MSNSFRTHSGRRARPRGAAGGFTLIELMIVVAIVAVIAAIAIPKFGELITKSKEATAKGALGTFRSALDIYYVGNQGLFPANTQILITGGYIGFLPKVQIPPWVSQGNPGHGESDVVQDVPDMDSIATINEGANIWAYVNAGNDLGHVAINCSHRDSKGSFWSAF
jgi:prepilin-type N-terminal cleavage/methylation domain-containing protein